MNQFKAHIRLNKWAILFGLVKRRCAQILPCFLPVITKSTSNPNANTNKDHVKRRYVWGCHFCLLANLQNVQNNCKFTRNAFSDGISLQGICKIGKLSDKAFSDSLSSVEGGATCTVCEHSQEAE